MDTSNFLLVESILSKRGEITGIINHDKFSFDPSGPFGPSGVDESCKHVNGKYYRIRKIRDGYRGFLYLRFGWESISIVLKENEVHFNYWIFSEVVITYVRALASFVFNDVIEREKKRMFCYGLMDKNSSLKYLSGNRIFDKNLVKLIYSFVEE